MTPAETGPGGEAEVQEWMDLDSEVKKAGIFVHEAGLHGGSEGKTGTVRDGAGKDRGRGRGG